MKLTAIFHSIAAFAIVVVTANVHAQEVAACDLIQSSVVPGLMREPVSRHIPNRQFQMFEGAKISTCIFFGNLNRVHLTLQEFPDATKASQAYAKGTISTDFAKFSPADGLGEKAVWWTGATEAYGYVVLKGKRVLSFDSRWGDSNNGAGLKEQMRPIVLESVRRM
ncbi:MAG: hypothetical protein HYX43_17425 [Burkholderiales bacterium]|nr:hypothetical protein [Burkholderiales bacterium]